MAELLKNHYNKKYITQVARVISEVHQPFDNALFIGLVFDDKWEAKELKDRMNHVAYSLHKTLPPNYEEAINILKIAAPLMDGVSEFGGFLNMFFPAFVEIYGQKDWGISIPALEEFTKYSSSEFAVRPFIKQNPTHMMAQMMEWAKHKNYHVRRLASEGCRPRLPWAMALSDFKKDPSPILPILHSLKNDDEEYVRRSVANNLNDIAKDNPEIVIDIAKQWYGKNKNTNRLVKHACRTLLKEANKEALAIFGFTDSNNVKIQKIELNKNKISFGDDLLFSCELNIKKSGKLRLEYAIDFMKANGKPSRKIFQIKEGDYNAGDFSVQKKHSFRAMTTRKHYEGEHSVAILVNGVELANKKFLLVE